MRHPELNEDQVTQLVRDTDARAEHAPSAAVWGRVEAHLDAAAQPRLRVVHRANRGRMRVLLAVAACLLAVFGLTWYTTTTPDQDGAVLSEVDIQRTIERGQLQGPLELEGETTTLRRSIYDGVVVKVGELRTDALQVCEAC